MTERLRQQTLDEAAAEQQQAGNWCKEFKKYTTFCHFPSKHQAVSTWLGSGTFT